MSLHEALVKAGRVPTMTPRESLHKRAKTLRAEVSRKEWTSGICNSLEWMLPMDHETKDLLRALCAEWPEGTGSRYYPVPGPNDPGDGEPMTYREMLAEADYDSSLPKWTGEYGRRRRALLDYIIKQTEPY